MDIAKFDEVCKYDMIRHAGVCCSSLFSKITDIICLGLGLDRIR